MSNFFEDLVRIRKEKRLSRQDVLYKCRIPIETIESIEDGSIFSGQMRNKTYIRSYFRTYGKAIGINDEDMTTALDEHESGLYESGLISKYITGVDPSDPAKTDEGFGSEPTGTDASSRLNTVDSESNTDPDRNAKKTKPGKIITPESQEKTLEDVEWEDLSFPKIQSTSTTGFGSSESPGFSPPSAVNLPDPPDVRAIDWSSKVKKAVYRPQKNRLFWVIIAIVLAAGLALASILWYWKSDERTTPMQTAPEQTTDALRPGPESVSPYGEGDPGFAAGDTRNAAGAGGGRNQGGPAAGERNVTGQNTLQNEAPEPVEQPALAVEPASSPDPLSSLDPAPADQSAPAGDPSPASERIELTEQEIITRLEASASTGDTLFVFAYALHGNLEPVRVLSDLFTTDRTIGNIPRPYWVEHRQMMRFDFLDEIIFQGNLSRMAIIFNGHLIQDYEAFFLDGSRIRISRENLIENGLFEFTDVNPFTDIDTPRSIVYRPRF